MVNRYPDPGHHIIGKPKEKSAMSQLPREMRKVAENVVHDAESQAGGDVLGYLAQKHPDTFRSITSPVPGEPTKEYVPPNRAHNEETVARLLLHDPKLAKAVRDEYAGILEPRVAFVQLVYVPSQNRHMVEKVAGIGVQPYDPLIKLDGTVQRSKPVEIASADPSRQTPTAEQQRESVEKFLAQNDVRLVAGAPSKSAPSAAEVATGEPKAFPAAPPPAQMAASEEKGPEVPRRAPGSGIV